MKQHAFSFIDIDCKFIDGEVGRILFIYRKNSTKKDKENKTKENYVQRTTIYNNYIGTQQINSSGTAYLLMC